MDALQPTSNWRPESIIRAFARRPGPGTAAASLAMPATPPTVAAPAGGLAALGFGEALDSGEAATQATPAGLATQVPSGESLLLAPRGSRPQTVASNGMPLSGGDARPRGGAYPPAETYLDPRQAEGTGRGAAHGGR